MKECKFCKSILSSERILNHHLRTARKCLLLQNRNIDLKWKCKGCLKAFSLKQTLNRHKNICTIFLKREIERLRSKLILADIYPDSSETDSNESDIEITV